MTLTKGLGINPTLFLHFTFPLQIAGFLWRARQDSNLRPSLFVVRFFERDAVGYGAKTRFLKEFGGMRRVAAVSGSRLFPRQRCGAALL